MKRKPDRTPIILAVTLAALFILMAGGIGFIASVGYYLYQPRHVEPAAKRWERDALRVRLKDATQAEVLQVLGKPHRTDDTGGNAEWMYDGATFDKVNGKTDGLILIQFRNGKVRSIIY